MLAASDSPVGLREAIDTVMAGASRQICRVHFMRNALVRVPRGAQAMAAAAIRTIFAQPDRENASSQLRRVADSRRSRSGAVSGFLETAEHELPACMAFPGEHRRQLCSTNPLERINKEIKRRSNAAGIFPNREAVIRLAGAVLMEQQDEWESGRRYFSMESMRKALEGFKEEPILAGLQM